MTDEPKNLTGVRAHPPLLALLHLIAAFLLGWLVPLPLPQPGWLFMVGWGIVLAGIVLAFWAVRYFHVAQTTLDPHGGTTAIVSGGPYRFTRNPIYVGYVCMVIGFPLIINMYWGLILAPLLVVLTNRLVIEYEEAYLAAQFGQPYLDFKASVRRWL